MANNTKILSTASLDGRLLQKAADEGVLLDAMSFIKISAVEDEALVEKVVDLCYVSATIVFTSVNAVKAVSDIIMAAEPQWDIYCLGNATQAAVLSQFPSCNIVAVANNAAELATIIIEDGEEEEVVFFCGDQRLDTLPDTLRKNKIEVYEVVVYRMQKVQNEISENYDGILFFSPSAVDSFFSANKIDDGVVLFAIGNTTANATKKHTANKVVFSETASKESMVDYAIKYFKNK